MDKEQIYRGVFRDLSSLLAGETDTIARMSSICTILKEGISWTSWVGFYRVVDPKTLAVGPYQGSVGCLRISIGSGACGTAASEERTQLVPDVHAYPGHIACDPKARSEIVIPVHGPNGSLLAVLDLDSHLPGAFDEVDRKNLEKLAQELVVCPST